MRKNEFLFPFIGIIIVILFWKIITFFQIFSPVILPPPEDILKVLLLEIKNKELFNHISISIFRVSIGVFLATITGVFLGLLMGWFKPIFGILDG